MRSLLVDEKGNKRLWNDFRKEAQKIDPKYNQQWLEAEYNMAIRQARSAKQWQGFEKAKDMYPNLEYMASRSASPSEAHRKLWGTILPIEHPFWDTAMPPSRWNCKCWVKQSDAEPTTKQVEAPESLPGIAGNSGKSGQVFDASHAYINKLSKFEKKEVQKELKKLEENNTEVILFKVGNNAIEIAVNTDYKDMAQNVEYLIPFVKKYKENYGLNPHVGTGKKPELNNKKSIGDLTTWDDAKTVYSYVQTNYKAKYQTQLKNYKEVFVAFDFKGKLNKTNYEEMWKALNGKIKASSRLNFVMLKNGDKVLILKKGISYENGLAKTKKELL